MEGKNLSLQRVWNEVAETHWGEILKRVIRMNDEIRSTAEIRIGY